MKKGVIKCVLSILLTVSLFMSISLVSVSASIDWNCSYVYISYYGQVVDSITFNGITVQSMYAPRNKVANYDSDTTLCCAAFAKRFYQNVFGIGIYNLYNGSTPYISSGGGYFTETSSPVVGDIARGPNHWAIVKAVSGNTITLIEQNAWNSSYTSAEVGRKIILPESSYTYFHYSGNSGNTSTSYWYDSLPITNIGDDLYAILLKNDGWVDLANVNDNVEIARESQDSFIMWHFVRQSDGSYVIYNCKNNKVLDVANADKSAGTNVQVCSYNGSDAQKWYIYGSCSGEYVFRPKLCDKVLDVSGNGNAVGTNVQIWDYNGSNAQKFAIYPFEKAGSSVLSVIAGDSATETKFTWAAASGATLYNLRIKSGVPGNTASYQDIWGVTETSYNIVLPAGYYEVYVDAANFFSYAASNTVKFYVEECDHIHDFSSKESISDDEHQLICSICGYTKTESHNNVNGVCDVCGKSIYYDYTILDDGTVEITRNLKKNREEIIIPNKIENKPVTNIGAYVFNNNYVIKNIIIPDSIINIDEGAFSGLYNLQSITIPNSVAEIGDVAFSADTSLESVTIPDSVKVIGTNAFSWCGNLNSITIPKSVTSIGEYAFAWDDNLTSVTIYSNNVNIGEKAFGYIHGSNGNIDKMEGFTIIGYNGSTAETYAKENGFTFIPLDETSKLGDVNSDGDVTIDDVTLIQKYLVSVSDFTIAQKKFADVNNDGEVNIDDVTMIQKYLAGIITELG